MLNELSIQVHGGAPTIAVEEVLNQYLGGTIVYGESNCNGGCNHHHNNHDDK
jgi:hypothetical protein